MAAVIELPAVSISLPTDWKPREASSSSLSAPVKRRLLPTGTAYQAHVRRLVHKRNFDEDEIAQADEARRKAQSLANGDDSNGGDDLGVGDEEETVDLLLLDPKEWKKQDHYKVLGLSHLRYKATQDQIKIAHRKKVLKHHPDKKAGSGDANDDAFFKCIQKAMEVLSHPEKRRQFDSVDPYYLDLEENVPIPNNWEPNVFFAELTPVFEREARFSRVQPVPMLGGIDDSKAAVEGFYDFWYNFDSWRSFEYLDKEVNEGSDSRDDKRYTEKKNKSERARRKKEDTARLRGLVDLALQHDPRIRRIKQEEKEARDAKKRTKGNASSGVSTPSQTAQEEAKRKAEEAKAKEEAEKVAKAEAKKAKAAAANAAKKARRAQRAEEGGA